MAEKKPYTVYDTETFLDEIRKERMRLQSGGEALSLAEIEAQIPPEIIKRAAEDVLETLKKNPAILEDLSEKTDKNALYSKIFMLTCMMESTQTSKNKDNTYNTEPINHFYFCSANALTIGYGTKIEYKDGKLCPEGLAVLEKLDIKRNNVSLTMAEKKQLVEQCFKKRNARDKLAVKGKASSFKNADGKVINCSKTPTKKLSPRSQAIVLFGEKDYPVISKANAIEVAHGEMKKKLDKLIKENPGTCDSYFSQALLTDLAYQYGDTGVTSKNYYENLKQKKFPSTLGFSQKSLTKDERCKCRELMCKMACRAHNDAQKRKGRLATEQEKTDFCLYGLKEFTKMFGKGIINHESNKIVLMEEFMTLSLLQSTKSGKEGELTLADIQRAKEKAHTLVYDSLFHSPIIQQVPSGLQPYAIVNAINSLPNTVGKQNTRSLEDIIASKIPQAAQRQVNDHNKKHKTNLKLVLAESQEQNPQKQKTAEDGKTAIQPIAQKGKENA